MTEATKRGLRASAIPDITSRARITFRLVNGVPQTFEADGQTARVGKDGMTPLSLAEWIDLQVSEAPHLFESNAGGGGGGATSQYSNGSGGAGDRPVKNPQPSTLDSQLSFPFYPWPPANRPSSLAPLPPPARTPKPGAKSGCRPYTVPLTGCRVPFLPSSQSTAQNPGR